MFPIGKYISQDYRDTLQVPDAPQNINPDIPILPVAVVNNGLPRPQANQTIYTYYKSYTAADNNTLITKGNDERLYLLGVAIINNSTVASSVFAIFDGSSGAKPASPNALIKYTAITLAAINNSFVSFPIPIEFQIAIRTDCSTPTPGTVEFVLYYMVEKIVK